MKKTATVLLSCFLATGISWAQTTALQYCQAGNTLYGQKNYDQAIRYYEAALDADATNWQAFQGLGDCYYAKGDNAKALSNYQRSLSLHPDNPALTSFTASLRTQANAANQPAKPTHLTEEEEKILRQANGQSDAHFELAPALAVVTGLTTNLGFGLGGSGFYMLDANWGLGGMAHLYFSSDSYETDSALTIAPAAKFKFGGRVLNPYLLGGFGLTLVSATVSSGQPQYGNVSAAGIFPVFAFGLGLEFHLSQDLGLFAEARADSILVTRGSVSYTPLEVGILFSQL